MEIVRWTTPSISFKPSATTANNITEIVLAISQNGANIIKKFLADATIASGTFTWQLTQTESAALTDGIEASVRVDYLTNTGLRYTVRPQKAAVSSSALNEVLE